MTGEDEDLRLEAAERARLIAQFEKTGNEALLRAACCLRRESGEIDKADVYRLLNEAAPRGRGNTEINDTGLLDQMALVMLSENLKRWPAALKVAGEHPGHSMEATAARLDRKFAKEPGKYLDMARLILCVAQNGTLWQEMAQAQGRSRWLSQEMAQARGRSRWLSQEMAQAQGRSRWLSQEMAQARGRSRWLSQEMAQAQGRWRWLSQVHAQAQERWCWLRRFPHKSKK